MPPDGYTTVTISSKTAARLSELMAQHEIESMSLAIDHAVQRTLNDDQVTNAELAWLLYRRLKAAEGYEVED